MTGKEQEVNEVDEVHQQLIKVGFAFVIVQTRENMVVEAGRGMGKMKAG